VFEKCGHFEKTMLACHVCHFTIEKLYHPLNLMKRFRGECSIKTWLCQIAKNTCYKCLKTHAKETYLEEELHQEQEDEAVSTVIEPLAECKVCTKYYEVLGKEMEPMIERSEADNKYVLLAAKIRKRRIGVSVLVGIVVWIFCSICLNYALGYRLNSKAAADLSGRLNFESEMIASYEWKDDYHFYIYDSYSCYDVIGVEKTWHGWKKTDSCLNWPKWSRYHENLGIEVAGALCHFRYYEGVQIFPIIAYDSNVKTVEVICYEQTQTKDVKTDEFDLQNPGSPFCG